MPQHSSPDGYQQALAGAITDGTLYDSNNATDYVYQVNGSSQTAAITIFLDYGSLITTINKLRVRYLFNGQPFYLWEYSANGISWTSVPFSTGGGIPSDPGGIDSTSDITLTVSGTINARYIRFSLSVTDTDGFHANSRAGVWEIEALDASNVHINENPGPPDGVPYRQSWLVGVLSAWEPQPGAAPKRPGVPPPTPPVVPYLPFSRNWFASILSAWQPQPPAPRQKPPRAPYGNVSFTLDTATASASGQYVPTAKRFQVTLDVASAQVTPQDARGTSVRTETLDVAVSAIESRPQITVRSGAHYFPLDIASVRAYTPAAGVVQGDNSSPTINDATSSGYWPCREGLIVSRERDVVVGPDSWTRFSFRVPAGYWTVYEAYPNFYPSGRDLNPFGVYAGVYGPGEYYLRIYPDTVSATDKSPFLNVAYIPDALGGDFLPWENPFTFDSEIGAQTPGDPAVYPMCKRLTQFALTDAVPGGPGLDGGLHRRVHVREGDQVKPAREAVAAWLTGSGTADHTVYVTVHNSGPYNMIFRWLNLQVLPQTFHLSDSDKALIDAGYLEARQPFSYKAGEFKEHKAGVGSQPLGTHVTTYVDPWGFLLPGETMGLYTYLTMSHAPSLQTQYWPSEYYRKRPVQALPTIQHSVTNGTDGVLSKIQELDSTKGFKPTDEIRFWKWTNQATGYVYAYDTRIVESIVDATHLTLTASLATTRGQLVTTVGTPEEYNRWLKKPDTGWDSYIYGQVDYGTEGALHFMPNGTVVLYFVRGGQLYRDTNTRYGHFDGWQGAVLATDGNVGWDRGYNGRVTVGQAIRSRIVNLSTETGPPVIPRGDLVLELCNSLDGSTWRDSVVVHSGVNRLYMGAVCQLADKWAAVYTAKDAGTGQESFYWKETYDPNDWSAATPVKLQNYPMGIGSMLYTHTGEVLMNIGIASRDQGATWHVRPWASTGVGYRGEYRTNVTAAATGTAQAVIDTFGFRANDTIKFWTSPTTYDTRVVGSVTDSGHLVLKTTVTTTLGQLVTRGDDNFTFGSGGGVGGLAHVGSEPSLIWFGQSAVSRDDGRTATVLA